MTNRVLAIPLFGSRTFLSIIGGVVAGIMGLTGLTGFIFYFLMMAISSLGLAAKAGFSIHSYFDHWNRIAFEGFFGGLLVSCELCFISFLVKVASISSSS